MKNSWSSWVFWASQADGHRPLPLLWKYFLICLIFALSRLGSAQPLNSQIHNFDSVIHSYRIFPGFLMENSSAHFPVLAHQSGSRWDNAASIWKTTRAPDALRDNEGPYLMPKFQSKHAHQSGLTWYVKPHFCLTYSRMYTLCCTFGKALNKENIPQWMSGRFSCNSFCHTPFVIPNFNPLFMFLVLLKEMMRPPLKAIVCEPSFKFFCFRTPQVHSHCRCQSRGTERLQLPVYCSVIFIFI